MFNPSKAPEPVRTPPITVHTSFETTVSKAWVRASVGVISGLLVIIIMARDGNYWLRVLESPARDPIAFAGVLLAAYAAVVVPYFGLSNLFQKITVHNGSLVVRSLVRTKTVNLLELASISSHTEARGKAGHYCTYLDISDRADNKASIQIHHYRNETTLAEILLSVVDQKQVSVDRDARKILREMANSLELKVTKYAH